MISDRGSYSGGYWKLIEMSVNLTFLYLRERRQANSLPEIKSWCGQILWLLVENNEVLNLEAKADRKD
jgi:hypothetical protein